MAAKYQDGQLVHLSPTEIKDMSLGGNTRRKQRPNWAEFVDSIKTQGVLQSVVARLMPDGSLALLAGYGRRDAAIEAGIETIPTLIRVCDDATALLINLTENTDRAELNFSDQVLWAKQFISLYSGDVASAAQRLSWSESKLRERLCLVTCTDGVLDALDDGSISVRHALILAAFDPQVQNNTLKKLLAEKWSVNELKARADKVQVPLSKAIFDRAECGQCVHNTELQAGLFGMAESALCSKASCFNNKTKEALETAKKEAEERFGTVVWLSQSLAEHRITVTPAVVGEAQFSTGCMGCANRIAVMDDAPHGTPGAVMTSQCTDKTCFTECSTAHDAYQAAQQTISEPEVNETIDTVQSDPAEQDANVVNMAKGTAKAKQTASKQGAVSQVLIDTHWRELRDAGSKVLVKDRKFGLVMQLIGLMELSKFKSVGDPAKKMAVLMNMPEEKLEGMIVQVIEYCATQAGTINGYDANKVITAATVEVNGGKDDLVASWTPCEATLAKYTTVGLEQIITLSGLDSFCESKEKGAGKKLSAGKKGDVIKQMLAVTDFDWTHFAPPAYLELMDSFLDKAAKAA